ncbi:hypothetical protein [Legionella cardiaca]|uniref:Secreted protein n=1 Tax=Legionella cardiaca TaxID=1071983 RepID=A0ABY8AQG9_9GAMM|nr:hypothetical protein [Legionella cardiaca]WED42674.1 hypothetical protein PXX05_12310 [Legionella cardiaca]
MMMLIKFLFFLCCLFISSFTQLAARESDPDSYFSALALIKKPPADSIAILACDHDEKIKIINMIKKSGSKLDLDENGLRQITIYKGDFSNEGFVEYAVVISEGSIHWEEVFVYRMENNKIVDIKLNKIIANNFYHGNSEMMTDYSMREFNHHTANPFAVSLKGKTYLRFMEYPARSDYDKTKLLLCTYLWQGKQFTLAGPNWTFLPNSDQLVAAKNCPDKK